jgi:TonB family protein
MGVDASDDLMRRRIRRHAIAVPIDVVVLRSGVPASIPGRTVNVSERGVATMLAGELSPGEPVGVAFRLPMIWEPIHAKAIVRHYSLMQCGLEFLAMPMEQENALRVWSRMTDQPPSLTNADAVRRRTSGVSQVTKPKVKPSRRFDGLHWAALSVLVAIVLVGGVAWWSWNTGWHELERGDDAVGNAPTSPVDVSGSIMAQRITHRVDPIYPSEALNEKIQGEVTLEALIGEDGTVRAVYPVSGPEMLRAAAQDAVKWWRFEPYRVNGRPAPVRTSIAVDFRLDR